MTGLARSPALFSIWDQTARTRRGPHAPRRADLPPADMQKWLEQVKSLPDLRWEKVQTIRQALAADRYSLDSRLTDLLNHLPDELTCLSYANY